MLLVNPKGVVVSVPDEWDMAKMLRDGFTPPTPEQVKDWNDGKGSDKAPGKRPVSHAPNPTVG